MRIGDLNKRINIEAPSKVSDSMGGFTETWTAIASSVPAAIWPTSANDIAQLNTTNLEVTHRIRIRYRSVIRGAWRISWGGRYFAITSIVDPNMDHKFIDLLCRESRA